MHDHGRTIFGSPRGVLHPEACTYHCPTADAHVCASVRKIAISYVVPIPLATASLIVSLGRTMVGGVVPEADAHYEAGDGFGRCERGRSSCRNPHWFPVCEIP